MPLVPWVTLQHFQKWVVVDFVCPINPPKKRIRAQYRIAAIDYLTRGAEAAPVVDYTAVTTTIFLFDNIVMWFGCTRVLMSDQGNYFVNRTV